MTGPFVDGIAVQLHLLRTGLGDGVNVYTEIPDGLSKLLPAVVIRRTGGNSDRPEFTSQFWTHYQVWHTTDELAYELARTVGRLIYAAKVNQTVTPYGWIAGWRESSGFQQFRDPGLPDNGRYDATLDLIIRNPRS